MAKPYSYWANPDLQQKALIINPESHYFFFSDDGVLASEGITLSTEATPDGNITPGFCGAKTASFNVFCDIDADDLSNNPIDDGIRICIGVQTGAPVAWRTYPAEDPELETCWLKYGNTELVGRADGLVVNGNFMSEIPIRYDDETDSPFDLSEGILSLICKGAAAEEQGIYFYSRGNWYFWSSPGYYTEESPCPEANMPVRSDFGAYGIFGDSDIVNPEYGYVHSWEITIGLPDPDVLTMKIYDASEYTEYDFVCTGRLLLDNYELDLITNSIQLDYIDEMHKFDVSADALIASLPSTFSGARLFGAICTAAGVNAAEGLPSGLDRVYNKSQVFATSGLTLRDIYGYLAETVSSVGYIDPEGKAAMYDLTTTHTLGIPVNAVRAGGWKKYSQHVRAVTKVVVYCSDGSSATIGTSDDNIYASYNNPLATSADVGLAFAQRIYAGLSGYPSYYPQEIELVEAMPYVEPLVLFYVDETPGTPSSMIAPMTSYEYTWAVRGKGTITAAGDSSRRAAGAGTVNGYNGTAALTIATDAVKVLEFTNTNSRTLAAFDATSISIPISTPDGYTPAWAWVWSNGDVIPGYAESISNNYVTGWWRNAKNTTSNSFTVSCRVLFVKSIMTS